MTKNKTLYVMVGIPGSGKSTFINTHCQSDWKIVSRDQVRFSIVREDEEYFSKEKKVFKTFIEEIVRGLKDYDITVADATHLNQGSRLKLLNSLGVNLRGVKVEAIVLRTSLETALERNSQRIGRELVPEESIKNMFNNFTIPKFEEGFDAINIVEEDGEIKRYILESGWN